MANRLQFETSPYLLQHAHNPVDWYPWCEEALQRAREEQKLILVSIGYSACHWCHVMERESFEDQATAEIMNRHFISIKVDREERPDLDQVFMDAVQAISGSGGWPLNVFLTPEGKPFYGGTYFPPVRAYNRSSWREVLYALQQAWREKPGDILEQADTLTEHIRTASQVALAAEPAALFEVDQLASVGVAILQSADRQWGGFGKAPKFPQTMSIQWLLRQYYYFQTYGSPADLPFHPLELLRQATLTLDKMMAGGMYDHLGGGFARYSTDERWLAPHFEKMLYDNALLVSVYSEAYQLTRADRYAMVIRDTLAFVEREWQHPDGGFCSALDADSEGAEGRYYTWQRAEVQQVLGEGPLADLCCDYYNISDEGNWEGTNILWTPQPLEAFCMTRGLDPDDTRQHLAAARAKLLAGRSHRVRPLLDDKKLLGWNALMITACCKAWAALGEVRWLEMACRCAGYLEAAMTNPAGGYHHNEKNGKAANPAFLDDLAYYAEALIHLQEATGEVAYLQRAKAVMELIISDFSDERELFFYFTPHGQQDILVRKIETYDGATPAGNSVMAFNLYSLGILCGMSAWQERAAKMLARVQQLVGRYPNSFANWAQMMQWMVYTPWEMAVVGPEAGRLAREVLTAYLPNKVLQWTTEPVVADQFPLLAGKTAMDKTALLYPCRQYACQSPVDSLADFRFGVKNSG
ncbi:MAG: thioredoxin domain-containing protein [Chitinophagaceae bacterium]|nr:thioredoxin domain-containing protein [Chitinophagaceae bacterium]